VAALPEATAVRPGLMLYGVRPAPHMSESLAPVMTLRAPVVAVRSVRKGESVGYGASWVADRDTRIATLGLGYADGLSWRAGGGRGHVWLAGELRPLCGRVSMDSVGVEIGEAPVGLGDQAVLFGRLRDGGGYAVEEAAADVESLAYELLVRVGRRVQRHYVNANGVSAS
jgi:alanine racemase